MVFSQRTRIATYTWGAAYLSDTKVIAVLDQGQTYNKSDVKQTVAELGLEILPGFTSVRQRGTKGFVYKTAPVNA
jgi:hypothetical protein